MLKKSICALISIAFLITTLTPAHSKERFETVPYVVGLPEPGTMVNLSAPYQPAILKGLTVHKDNPFMFDFLVDVGQDKLQGDRLKDEGNKLIKYFMASLAVPEKDLWVNLSPYEKQKIVTEALGQTDMGQDLLAQDYILKQITASLIYPEKELGKKFWDNVYQKTQAKYGKVNIPVNTFNKVWIMADKAEVFERNQTAFVTASHLKVMLEEDYLATKNNVTNPTVETRFIASQTTNRTTQNIIKEIILPELENEINTGKNFANLRQIFNSIILASWYKNNLKQSLLNEVYANKNKVSGIDIADKTIKQKIYERYLQAYKKGVFNYIKEEPTVLVPHKYFSGGVIGNMNVKVNHNMEKAGASDMRGNGIVAMRTQLQNTAMYPNDNVSPAMLAAIKEVFKDYPAVDIKFIEAPVREFIVSAGPEDYMLALAVVLIVVGMLAIAKTNKDALIEQQKSILDSFQQFADENHAKTEMLDRLNGNPSLKRALMVLNEKDARQWFFHEEVIQRALAFKKFIRQQEIAKDKSMLTPTAILEKHQKQLIKEIDRLQSRPDSEYLKSRLIAVVGVLANKQGVDEFVDILRDRVKNAPYDAQIKAILDEFVSIQSEINDKAMYGGIDLEDAAANTTVSKQGEGVEFVVDAAMIERVRREGIESLTPVILRIDPVVNILPLFGVTS